MSFVIKTYEVFLRREGDSNPRYAFDVNSLSRRAPSATRPSLLLSIMYKTRAILICDCKGNILSLETYVLLHIINNLIYYYH